MRFGAEQRRRVLRREHERELRPSSELALELDPPAVGPHDVLDNREAQSRPLFLARQTVVDAIEFWKMRLCSACGMSPPLSVTEMRRAAARRCGVRRAGVVGSSAPQIPPRSDIPPRASSFVFVNGRIHTMDGRNTIANTVSIVNGRFSAVGGTAPRRGTGIRLIDLKGRTVVPGIIDNHNHIVADGQSPRLPHAARERALDS